MAEHDEQVAVVKWFKRQYPRYKDCLIAIPNAQGLAKTKTDAIRMWKKLEKEGAKRGASDLFLAVPKNGLSGLWVEMKDKGKTKCSLSDVQEDHLYLMIKMGYGAVWCAGADAAIEQIRAYLGD